MPEPIPQPGDLSGYINNSLRWMHSAWDPDRGWVDVGYDDEQARERAAAIRDRALGVREDGD